MVSYNGYICCCPICGSELAHKIEIYPFDCWDCGGSRKTTKEERKQYNTLNRRIAFKYISQQPKAYYEQLSTHQYGDSSHWKEIFVEQELSKNPMFDRNKYLCSCQRQAERDRRIAERNARQAYREAHPEEFKPAPPKPQPKCPTCGSTNIRKISDLRRGIHGVAWGLLSTTARSQFECKNCGYKW